MITKVQLSKRAIIRKLDKSISNSEIEKKFIEVLDEKKINKKVFLDGETKDSAGFLDMKVGVKKTIGTSKLVMSYVLFREFTNVPLLKNARRLNYGAIFLIENDQYIFCYLESFPNITSWLEVNSSPIGINQLKKVFSGKVEFKNVSIRNPKPTMFEVSGLTIDGKNVKSNVGVFGKERQVLQRITTGNSSGNLTVDVNKEKIKASGARGKIDEYLKWVIDLTSCLESSSKVTSATNSFFDGFMVLASEKEISILQPKRLYINEMYLENLINNKKNVLLTSSKQLKSHDVNNVIQFFRYLNTIENGDYSLDIELLNKLKNVNVEFNFLHKKNIFEVNFKRFPKIFIQGENGRESLMSLLINEAIGLSFDNSDFVQIGRKIYKSALLKDKVMSVSKILKPQGGLFECEFEKYNKKTDILKANKFPKKSVFYIVEEFIKKPKDNKVFLDDLGNEWCDYLSYNLKNNEIQFIHCKHKEKPTEKEYSVSASHFQDVLGQAQKNIGNLLHGDKYIEKKIKTKIVGKKYKGSNILYDRNATKLSSDEYYEQYLEVFNSLSRKIKVVLAINFISKRSFINDIKNELYKENPYFWQQIYFLISASEFYRQLGIDFEVWCGE